MPLGRNEDQTSHHQGKCPTQGLVSLVDRKFYHISDHNLAYFCLGISKLLSR